MHLLLLSSLLACSDKGADSGAALDPIEIDVALSEVITTVPTVTWEAEEVQAAWVVVEGAADAWRVAVDLSQGSPYATPILGLKPASTWSLSVEAQTPEGTRTSAPVEITTGTPPNDLPALTVDAIDPARMNRGYYLTGLVNPAAAVIVDSDGEFVWWYLIDGDDGVVRLHLSADGRTMVMGSLNPQYHEEVYARRVTYDGTSEELYLTPYRHHDFTELPDGTITYFTNDSRKVGDLTVRGDQVVELAPDGTLTSVYSIWQDHDFDGAQDYPGESREVGWPHANYVQYLPEDDDYLVSFLHLKGIARIDRATGTQEWFLGGDDSTMFDEAGEADFFDLQHGLQMQEDSILVFVNGSRDLESRAVEVQLDPENNRAETTWEYWPDPSLGSPVLGDVHRFDDGNTLATFSFSGAVHEVTPAGEKVWEMSAGIGGAVTFLTYKERLQAE